MNNILSIILLAAILSGCTTNSFFAQNSDKEPSFGIVTEQPSKQEPSDILEQLPEEARDITIPYLRTLDYSGSSITIHSQHQSKSAYTSYISSYRSENFSIYGLLTKPNSQPPPGGYPAVVFIHGYIPPQQYRTTEKYVDYVDYLAKQGIVVFKIDLRGHGNSEGEPRGAYYSSGYIIDTLNAYSSLKTLDYVNAKNIGLWGHSMAGNVILRSLAVKPDIPKAVIWAGAVYTYEDMKEYGIQDGSYTPSQNPNRNRRQQLINLMGEVTLENPFWKQVAATTFLKEIQSIIHIHHSLDDPVVSVRYSQSLAELLKTAQVNHQLFTYPNGGHNLSSPAFQQAIERSAALFLQP